MQHLQITPRRCPAVMAVQVPLEPMTLHQQILKVGYKQHVVGTGANTFDTGLTGCHTRGDSVLLLYVTLMHGHVRV